MRINSLLGTEYKLNSLNAKKQEEINAKAARYIKYLQAQAELEKSKKVLEENQKSYSDYQKEIKESRFNFDLNPSKTATDKLSAINDAKAAVEKWSSVVASLESEFGIEPANFDYKPSGGGLSDEDSPIKKASDRYAESLNDLSAQLALGLMTQKEYERAKRDLIEKTRAEILASGDAGLMGSDFASGIANAFGTFAHGELRDREEAAVDMIDEYNAEIASLVRQANQKIITEEEYQRALGELTKRIYDELGALDLTGLSTSIINQVQAARSTARGINATTRTTPAAVKNAPSAVDLALMTPREQMEVRLNLEQDSLAELKKQADSQIGGLLDEIAAKEQNIQSLSELLETEKVKDALRGLRKDIAGGAWKGLESGVQGIDGMVNAFSQLREVMSDQDASGWEKFMAGFNALSQTVNTIIAVVQTIEMLMTAIKTLQALKEAQQAKENALATTEIARNTATAASEGGKSAMKKLPFPLNVLAIAGVIATVIGAFAALPKFAKGGIVGEGPRQGDKVLARLNRGEGVLTEQGLNGLGDLAGAARTAPIDVRISGKLKASGRDLELVIDQQQRFRKRTR